MQKLTVLCACPLLAAVFSGCVMLDEDRYGEERMRQAAEVQGVKADVARLNARLDTVVLAQEDLYRRLEALQSADQNSRAAMERKLAEVADGLQASHAARQQMKKELVDGLTKQISEVVRARPPASPRKQGGYEHVVEPGQTLSAIASAYGVSAKVIMDANRLTNPDQLRAGQKLFIPE